MAMPSATHFLSLVVAIATASHAVTPATPEGGSYTIPWSSIDAGAAVLEADGWKLSATIGQPDTDVAATLQGGGFKLRTGYWLTPTPAGDWIFSNGFE